MKIRLLQKAKIQIKLIEKELEIYNERLIACAKEGLLEGIIQCINLGANLKTNSNAAIKWSARNGHLKTVRFLTEKGADIRAQNDYALRWSAQNGHLEVVKYLVEQGANIHARDDAALRYSAMNGHLEVVKLLLEKGADIHADDDAALRMSAENDHLEIVKYLLEVGLNLEKLGVDIFKMCVKNKKKEISECLISSMPDNAPKDFIPIEFHKYALNNHIVYNKSGYEPMQKEYDKRKVLKESIKKSLPIKMGEILYKPSGLRMKLVESEFFNVEKSDEYHQIL